MIEQLQRLLALRELRETRARAQLADRRHVFEQVATELAAIDAQRDLIDGQRAAWERLWQQWLRTDGTLHHGQEFNLYHVKLSAWRREIEAQRTQAEVRLSAAECELRDAREAAMRREREAQLIRGELAAALRAQRARRVDIAEAHANEELISHRRGGPWPVELAQ